MLRLTPLITIAMLAVLSSPPAIAEYTISYQGQLQGGGEPFDGTVDMSFALHEHESDDIPIGPTINLAQVAVEDGLFAVDLDFGEVFTGQPLWLEVVVDGMPLTPRQRITSVPMALNVPAGAGSNWQRVEDDIHFLDGRVGIGTSDPAIALDVFSDEPFAPGSSNAVIAGRVEASGPESLIGLVVRASSTEVSEQPVRGVTATTNASHGTAVEGDAQAFAGPGIGIRGNTQSGEGFAAYFSGHPDSRNYFQRRVGIGVEDPAGELQVAGSSITGHLGNQATGLNSSVSGGRQYNAGPSPNSATGDASFVGGGNGNSATAFDSFVGGGRSNTASSSFAFIGGGNSNETAGQYSFIGGGQFNTTTGNSSFIAGGVSNNATGSRSLVAGGSSNLAAGDHSMAAGRRAKAINQGAFVWADSADADFESTGDNQYLIRATGGVGIGTNAPNSQLHVNALAGEDALRAQVDGQTALSVSSNGGVAIGGFTVLTPDNGLYVAGRTGLGTALPERDLHVKQASTANGEIGLQIERSDSSNNWAFYIATSDNLGFRYNDNLVARIDTSGQFATLSDARHKTDIGPIENPLTRLLALEPAQYRMRSSATDSQASLGLIAQQVRDVIPTAVSESDDTLGIRYNQITALNTAAIIELHALLRSSRETLHESRNRIDILTAENEALRHRLSERDDQLERRLLTLEAVIKGDNQVTNNGSSEASTE